MKFQIIALLCGLSLLLTACNKTETESKTNMDKNVSSSFFDSIANSTMAQENKDSYFSLHLSDDSVIIHRGDTLEKIKNKLGVSVLEISGNGTSVKYQGITICIRNDKYCDGFIIEPYDNAALSFKTSREIALGSTFEEIKIAYGEPTEFDEKTQQVFYVLKKEDDNYNILAKADFGSSVTEYYYIHFSLDDNQKVSRISVGDYHFEFFTK